MSDNNKNITVILLYIVGIYVVLFLFLRIMKQQKYKTYLRELGFNIIDRMNADEIQTSYIYLHDYAAKYKDQASQMLRSMNPAIWLKAKEVSDKYKIFNL